MALDICYVQKTMWTPVYIRWDSAEQLLLSERVCRQLAMINYHPDVEEKNGRQVREKWRPAQILRVKKRDDTHKRLQCKLIFHLKQLKQKLHQTPLEEGTRSGSPKRMLKLEKGHMWDCSTGWSNTPTQGIFIGADNMACVCSSHLWSTALHLLSTWLFHQITQDMEQLLNFGICRPPLHLITTLRQSLCLLERGL